ncbi:MAG TPA: nitroreductase [Burkholderiaceae bacterium]|nr:nitroreductase [Burkholderiaceae bacterium]
MHDSDLTDDHLAASRERAVAALLTRRSVSPKRLVAPGPDLATLELMLRAALAAPDHGGLHPWRVIEFRTEHRAELAALFEAEKLRRDPLATPVDLLRARDHALLPPVLLGFVVTPRSRTKIPPREQWLAAGAALGNLLNAAHQLGYGAIVLSGERCFDETLVAALGVAADEQLVGFVSIGTIGKAPPEARRPLPQTVWSCWPGPAAPDDPAAD